jgi:hypothetical protein
MLASSRRRFSNCASSSRSGSTTVTWKSYHFLLLFASYDALFPMAAVYLPTTIWDPRSKRTEFIVIVIARTQPMCACGVAKMC